MNRRTLMLGALILLIPILAVGWWLGSPLFLDDEVDEDLPDDIRILSDAEIGGTMEAAAAVDTLMDEDMPDVAMSESGEITAIEILQGNFRNGDDFHQGSGTATLFELSDGRHLLRFEDFEVTNGPDLHVYLVPNANETTVTIDDYIDLGELKGNIGAQNYFIEADIDIPENASIVIWCEPFSVLFSVASLSA